MSGFRLPTPAVPRRDGPTAWRRLGPAGQGPGAGGSVAIVVAALLAATFLGLMASVLPWWLVVATLLLPALAIAVPLFPEFAVLAALVLLSGLVPAGVTPRLPLGPGSIKAHELAIFLLFAFAFVRALGAAPIGPCWRWLRPVLAMLALGALAAVTGWMLSGAPVKDVLSDARNFAGWLLVFVVVGLVRSERQLGRLLDGSVVVGAAVALAVLVQFATGRPVLHEARVEQLVTLEQTSAEVTRSLAGGGVYLMTFALLLLLARLLVRRASWWWALPAIALLSAGLVVTFGRGLWVATFVSALGMAWALRRWQGMLAVVLAVAVSTALGLALLSTVKPRVLEAAWERVTSVGQESLARDTTLGWRAEETSHALRRIAEHPLLGIGFGVPYKPVVKLNGLVGTEQDEFLARYIHNGYLGLWLKLGPLGLAVALWLSWAVFRRGAQMLRRLEDPGRRALAAALVAGFAVPVLTSVTQPEWLWQAGIGFFALMLGALACLHRLAGPMPSAAGVSPADRSSHGRRQPSRPRPR